MPVSGLAQLAQRARVDRSILVEGRHHLDAIGNLTILTAYHNGHLRPAIPRLSLPQALPPILSPTTRAPLLKACPAKQISCCTRILNSPVLIATAVRCLLSSSTSSAASARRTRRACSRPPCSARPMRMLASKHNLQETCKPPH